MFPCQILFSHCKIRTGEELFTGMNRGNMYPEEFIGLNPNSSLSPLRTQINAGWMSNKEQMK